MDPVNRALVPVVGVGGAVQRWNVSIFNRQQLVGYLGSAQFERYLSAIFEAMWVNKKNLGKPEVVAEVITRAGLDPAEFARLVSDEEVKERLKGITEQAIQRGAFGAPTFFVGEEMFFGQDRLDFVAEALQRD